MGRERKTAEAACHDINKRARSASFFTSSARNSFINSRRADIYFVCVCYFFRMLNIRSSAVLSAVIETKCPNRMGGGAERERDFKEPGFGRRELVGGGRLAMASS